MAKLGVGLMQGCDRRHVTFIDKEGEKHTFEVADGDNLLDIAQANEVEMEGMHSRVRSNPVPNDNIKCRSKS